MNFCVWEGWPQRGWRNSLMWLAQVVCKNTNNIQEQAHESGPEQHCEFFFLKNEDSQLFESTLLQFDEDT